MSVHVAARTIEIDARLIWERLKVEVAGQPRAARAWLTFLAILIAFGAVGAALTIAPGDEVFGTTPAVEWGILIAAYVFFAVTTSGLCLASSLGTVFGIEMFRPLEKRHAILAVLFLVTGFGVIALDLHYPVRLMFGVVFSPSPLSPMWWMGVLYAIYLGFLLTEVWSMFRGHPQIHQAACVMSTVMAILAPSTLGAVFGILAARPFWHGSFTPVYVFLTALLSGTALLGIVFYCVQRFHLSGHGREATMAITALRILLAIALGVAIFLVSWQMIVGLYGGVLGAVDATMALLVGPLALQFWIFKVLIGLVVPFVLVALPQTRTPAGLFAASACALAGIFVDRMIFVSAGQIAPTSAASGIVSYPYAAYSPSLVEISIVVGALAFVALMYTTAEHFLNLGGYSGHGAARPDIPVDDRADIPVDAPVNVLVADSAGGVL
jgi:molybdopterin-containing oxidoreductase family membrane subunit